MSQPVDREGVFQAEIMDYELMEFPSGFVAISVRAALKTWWDGKQFVPWDEYDMEASGRIFIIKDDGTINDKNVQSLCAHAGWDGAMNSVVHGTWHPTPCQVVIQHGKEYKGQRPLEIRFINEHDRAPSGKSSIDAEKVKALETRFGSSLRAVAGTVKRNSAPASTSKMPAPAKPPGGAWKPETANEPAPATVPQDSEIPF